MLLQSFSRVIVFWRAALRNPNRTMTQSLRNGASFILWRCYALMSRSGLRPVRQRDLRMCMRGKG
jgi:hypothetical protein